MKLIAIVAVSGLFLAAGNAMAAVKTCQTPAQILAHMDYHTPVEFCFHKVENPMVGLESGKAIPRFNQLMPDLEVSFLNARKSFDEAQASCASLGAGWHAPASNKRRADPRATNNSNSLEAVGEYFSGRGAYYWSSSIIPNIEDGALSVWFSKEGDTFIDDLGRGPTYYVVCVKP